jgi:hypothetical protein
VIVSDAVKRGLDEVGALRSLIDVELALRAGLDALERFHAGLAQLVECHRGAGLGLTGGFVDYRAVDGGKNWNHR